MVQGGIWERLLALVSAFRGDYGVTHILVAVNGDVAEVQHKEQEALPPHDGVLALHCAVVGPLPSLSQASLT